MHTFLFIAAYLSATTVATPVAQLFDSFETDYATLSNQQDIKILPIDFTNTVGDSNAPPLAVLTGDTTTPSYLQAQVPPQDSFSNFGGGCPAQKLFCCQGGSGPPGALISDASFQAKCIPYNDENTLDDKCQLESNGSCCQSRNAPGGEMVWQCVTTPIKVVPRKEEEPADESQTPRGENGQWADDSIRNPSTAPPIRPNLDRPISPLLYHGKGNWESL